MTRLRPRDSGSTLAKAASPLAVLALFAVALAACSDSVTTTPTSPSVPPAPMTDVQSATATYEVTFDATWSHSSHPVDFPETAHYSPLIGGTHDARARFWNEGTRASDGIEAMAERGQVSPLDSEIERAIRNGTAEFVLRGESVRRTPATTSLRFTISQRFPLVTLVTMVAPSPDWFVGVAGLDLFAGGTWTSEITLPLYPWDAGTDDGATFLSLDLEAQPHHAIAEIRAAPLAPRGFAAPMGSLTFRRMG